MSQLKFRFGSRTRFCVPYKPGEKATNKDELGLDQKKGQSGVYFIKEISTGEVIYIGFSASSLYKTIYRHFQQWIEHKYSRSPRITYSKVGYLVRVIHTTPHRAWLLEKYFIMKYKPRDNKWKYDKYLSDSQVETAATIVEAVESAPITDLMI